MVLDIDYRARKRAIEIVGWRELYGGFSDLFKKRGARNRNRIEGPVTSASSFCLDRLPPDNSGGDYVYRLTLQVSQEAIIDGKEESLLVVPSDDLLPIRGATRVIYEIARGVEGSSVDIYGQPEILGWLDVLKYLSGNSKLQSEVLMRAMKAGSYSKLLSLSGGNPSDIERLREVLRNNFLVNRTYAEGYSRTGLEVLGEWVSNKMRRG